jgi:guanine deaminase
VKDVRGKIVHATGFQTPRRGEIDCFEDLLIAVDGEGVIERVIRADDSAHAAVLNKARADGRLETMGAGCFLLPAFIDLHIHAPQYPQLGQALDVPLEVWLQKHTFPLEARYADLAFARRSYGLLIDDLLANGTTTALYFATVHQDATRLLVDLCLEKGQRALVGKVAMDHPESCPPFYRDGSAAKALSGTEALIDYLQAHPDNQRRRVHPVITPRFIPACTDPLLSDLGALAKTCGCHVQTHVSESDWEHGYVLARHGVSDAESLDGFGLLGRRTVLAHGNFLSSGDLDRLKARGSAVAHCPLSNVYFAGAAFPLRAALEKGVRLGLGTDISGGPIASVFEAGRMAIAASRMLESGVDPDLPPESRANGRATRIDSRDAFYLATTGGGEALDLPVGFFAPGRYLTRC